LTKPSFRISAANIGPNWFRQKTDRVMADVDHALGQEILDVAQRQRVLTYIITTRRIASGELLKYRNGLPQPDTARKFALKLPCNPLQAPKRLLDGLPL
jgi:hypothetical protein